MPRPSQGRSRTESLRSTSTNLTAIHRLVERCRLHDHDAAVARLPSGWLVLNERQAFAGQCMLLPDPVMDHLNALSGTERTQFLADMALAGEAILECTSALRINYAMFGNAEPALHAHIIPRRESEPAEELRQHPWAIDWTRAPAYSTAEHGEIKRRIAAYLAAAMIEG
jgi:diadenosine tetraphosphate (Ap4A) HIT family hydrolase